MRKINANSLHYINLSQWLRFLFTNLTLMRWLETTMTLHHYCFFSFCTQLHLKTTYWHNSRILQLFYDTYHEEIHEAESVASKGLFARHEVSYSFSFVTMTSFLKYICEDPFLKHFQTDNNNFFFRFLQFNNRECIL